MLKILFKHIQDPPSTSAYNPQVEAISPTIDEPIPEYKKISDIAIAPKLNKIESDIISITQEIEDLTKLKVKIIEYCVLNI